MTFSLYTENDYLIIKTIVMNGKLFWKKFFCSPKQKRIEQLKNFDASWNIHVFPRYVVKSIAQQLKTGTSEQEKKFCCSMEYIFEVCDIRDVIAFAAQKYEVYKSKPLTSCNMNELDKMMFFGILWRLLIFVQSRREMCSLFFHKPSF